MKPFFSVIMAVYNHQDYVEQAIQSVLAQTDTDWELVVVNDGSTDGSWDVLKKLAARSPQIVLLQQANAGAAAARNNAVAHSRGSWIAYLDSDDCWFADTLASY